MKASGFVAIAALTLLASVTAPPARAATPAQVDQAIRKAQNYLYSRLNAQGNWEEVPQPVPNGGQADVKGRQWGGLTSIATYALLASGEGAQNKKLARPIAFLEKANLEGIYAIGLRCQVWLLMDDEKKLRPFMLRDAQALFGAIHAEAAKRQADEFGFYGYWYERHKRPPGPMPEGWYDRSVSQYGVLGMWALEQAGMEVPLTYWELVNFAWMRAQHPDGGWSYRKADGPDKGNSSYTMTAAGIATLFITQDYTLGNVAACRGNISNEHIERGLAWMDKHINEALNSGNYYGMYGIERIGVASGRKYFGTVNWYDVGADYMVKNQAADGSWGGDIPNTCFGLLFLSRGRAPVIFNKLQYSLTEPRGKTIEGPWNERPRDCANFVRWMGRNIEQHDLNWQVVNLNVSVDDLHDAPILYISGNRELKLSQEQINKLRLFVQQGGLILGNADCGSLAFTKSFKELGTKMFGYEFRKLDPRHLIFTGEQYSHKKGRPFPAVWGLSNGVREMMLLVPESDLSRAWQGRNEKTKEDLYQLGANIALYAVDKKNLRNKGETYIVHDDPAIKPAHEVTVARLEVGDNWNPEPAGWPRLAAILHNQDKLAVTVKDVKLDPANLQGVKIADLTGTTNFKLSDAQRQALRQFVEEGGTLIVDAAGGSERFADSAETELQATFGSALASLSPDSPVYNLPDSKIQSFRYRDFARRLLGNGSKTPRVQAIKIKNRPAIFYSREDLSAGLVGEPVDGVMGYDPATATAIMRNLVLFATFGPPRPATQPATAPTTAPTRTAPATAPAH